jgi:DNA-binding transcriptional ArsR family regulator
MDSDHKKEILDKLIKCEDINNPDLHFKQLRELGNNLIQNPSFDDLIKFVNAVANRKRLIIINTLKEKDRCVCELEAVLDESQPAISHHLKILENAGLIRGWKKGKFTHYDIVKEQIISYLDILNQKLI